MSTPIAATLAQLFDAASKTYDEVVVDFFHPAASSLLTTLDLDAGERVLDVGCGAGSVLLEAADLVGPTGWCLGLDLSPAMVDRAAREAATAGLTNVEVVVGDASDPRLPAESFDVIASSLMLFFLPDPALAVSRWLPLLRPGGRIGVATLRSVDPRWADLDPRLLDLLPSGMRADGPPDATSPFSTDEGVERLLREAGFADVRSAAVDLPVRFADEGTSPDVVRFVQTVRHTIGRRPVR